jgi:hypothetical protein
MAMPGQDTRTLDGNLYTRTGEVFYTRLLVCFTVLRSGQDELRSMAGHQGVEDGQGSGRSFRNDGQDAAQPFANRSQDRSRADFSAP